MKLIVLPLILLAFLTSANTANGLSGNGGDLVVCNHPSIYSNTLLDLFQARNDGFTPIKFSGKNWREIAQNAIDVSMNPKFPTLAKDLQEQLRDFSDNVEFIHNAKFEDINDSSNLALPLGCHLAQVTSMRPMPLPEQSHFQVNKNFWKKMNAENRAALAIQQVLFRQMIRAGAADSRGVRFLVGLIFSNRLQSFSSDDSGHVDLFKKLKYRFFEKAGIVFPLFQDPNCTGRYCTTAFDAKSGLVIAPAKEIKISLKHDASIEGANTVKVHFTPRSIKITTDKSNSKISVKLSSTLSAKITSDSLHITDGEIFFDQKKSDIQFYENSKKLFKSSFKCIAKTCKLNWDSLQSTYAQWQIQSDFSRACSELKYPNGYETQWLTDSNISPTPKLKWNGKLSANVTCNGNKIKTFNYQIDDKQIMHASAQMGTQVLTRESWQLRSDNFYPNGQPKRLKLKSGFQFNKIHIEKIDSSVVEARFFESGQVQKIIGEFIYLKNHPIKFDWISFHQDGKFHRGYNSSAPSSCLKRVRPLKSGNSYNAYAQADGTHILCHTSSNFIADQTMVFTKTGPHRYYANGRLHTAHLSYKFRTRNGRLLPVNTRVTFNKHGQLIEFETP